MKRTNGTDHTIVKKDTLEQKLQRLYENTSTNEKRSISRFKCIHTFHEHDDGYYFENSTIPNYDDEIYDD